MCRLLQAVLFGSDTGNVAVIQKDRRRFPAPHSA